MDPHFTYTRVARVCVCNVTRGTRTHTHTRASPPPHTNAQSRRLTSRCSPPEIFGQHLRIANSLRILSLKKTTATRAKQRVGFAPMCALVLFHAKTRDLNYFFLFYYKTDTRITCVCVCVRAYERTADVHKCMYALLKKMADVHSHKAFAKR